MQCNFGDILFVLPSWAAEHLGITFYLLSVILWIFILICWPAEAGGTCIPWYTLLLIYCQTAFNLWWSSEAPIFTYTYWLHDFFLYRVDVLYLLIDKILWLFTAYCSFVVFAHILSSSCFYQCHICGLYRNHFLSPICPSICSSVQSNDLQWSLLRSVVSWSVLIYWWRLCPFSFSRFWYI